MRSPMYQGENKKLHGVPVRKQIGSVPLYTACYFCYLELMGNGPRSAELVLGSRS
jgi:hypothetical protein